MNAHARSWAPVTRLSAGGGRATVPASRGVLRDPGPVQVPQLRLLGLGPLLGRDRQNRAHVLRHRVGQLRLLVARRRQRGTCRSCAAGRTASKCDRERRPLLVLDRRPSTRTRPECALPNCGRTAQPVAGLPSMALGHREAVLREVGLGLVQRDRLRRPSACRSGPPSPSTRAGRSCRSAARPGPLAGRLSSGSTSSRMAGDVLQLGRDRDRVGVLVRVRAADEHRVVRWR